jgi:hypothetical protein
MHARELANALHGRILIVHSASGRPVDFLERRLLRIQLSVESIGVAMEWRIAQNCKTQLSTCDQGEPPYKRLWKRCFVARIHHRTRLGIRAETLISGASRVARRRSAGITQFVEIAGRWSDLSQAACQPVVRL